MDQCQYGFASEPGEPMQKPTKWMSNAPCVISRLEKRCQGRGGACSKATGKRHTVIQGRALCRRAQECPFAQAKEIPMGCRRQLIEDGRLVLGVAGVQRLEENMPEIALLNFVLKYADEDPEVQLASVAEQQFVDSITGQPLNAELACAARRK